MIKTTPINSVRVLKVGVTLHFHFSDSIVYKGECWCIRGRHYEYGQPVETANEFLQNVTRGCLNRWTEHMNEKYGIQVDKNKVNPSTEVKMEYQCVEEMTTKNGRSMKSMNTSWDQSQKNGWKNNSSTHRSRNNELQDYLQSMERMVMSASHP